MSQTHATALDLAIAQAAERHLRCEKALASAQTRLRNAKTTFNTLDAYRAEYANRLRSMTHATKDGLANHRRFLDKLATAMDQQQQDVDNADQALMHRQSDWFVSLQKLKAMELLRSHREAAAQIRLKRLEQKQSDEFAARRLRRTHPRV